MFALIAAAATAGAVQATPAAGASPTVTLVPLDGFQAARVERLGDWLRRQLPVSVVVAAPLRLPDRLMDKKRRQLVAESSVEWFSAHVRTTGAVIGITPRDMYPRRSHWRFAFAEHLTHAPIGLISSWHMDPVLLGGVADNVLFQRRLQKYVLRNTLLLVLGRSLVNNPRSVLTDSVVSVDDLDAMEAAASPRARSPGIKTWIIDESHVCLGAQEELQRLAARPASSPRQVVAVLRRSADIDAKLIMQFAAVKPEASERPLVQEVVALLQEELVFDRGAVAGLARRFTSQRIARLIREDRRYASTIRAIFLELGLTACASS